MILGVLGVPWMGCSDDAGGAPQSGPVSQGIPAEEFEPFANLIRNIDQAQADLDAARALGNPATIREKGVMLAQQQQILTRLYIDKHGQLTIDKWIQTVRAAATAPSAISKRPASSKELEEEFTRLGATWRKDENGRMNYLDCTNIQLPADSVKHLAQLKYLRTLTLSDTGITDKDLEQFKNLKFLRKLDLGRNKLKGPGLRLLGSLENLEMLNLRGTGLTDQALPDLEAIDHLKKITVLNVEDTGFTTQGYERITRLFRRADVRF